MYDIIIIGGGAAGLFAAAAASAFTEGKPVSGLLLERGDEAGRKLLLTGAGQCNLTHAGSIRSFPEHYGPNGGAIRRVLYGFSNDALTDFFRQRGLQVFAREDGKVYPVSRDAREMRDFLEREARRSGFTLKLGRQVLDIAVEEGRFRVQTQTDTFISRALLICTGGCSYPATGSDGRFFETIKELGIAVTELRPALVPITVENYPYASLSGASVEETELSAEGQKTRGSLLFTHRSFSGPAALHMARYVRPGTALRLNYCPGMNREEAAGQIRRFRQEPDWRRKEIRTVFRELFGKQGLPEALLTVLFQGEAVDPHRNLSELTAREAERLLSRVFEDRFTVSGTLGFSVAMVTRGGVALSEVFPKTMESRRIPGLYFAGEVLDADGDTGGYNLQFAFSSAWAAMKDICGKQKK